MAISVELQSIRGFAVMPSDLSIGEAASIEGQIVSPSGDLMSASLKRFTIEASLKGVLFDEVETLVAEAEAGRLRLLRGQAFSGTTTGGQAQTAIGVGGFSLESPVLTSATPSGYLSIDGQLLVESVSIVFEDTVYK